MEERRNESSEERTRNEQKEHGCAAGANYQARMCVCACVCVRARVCVCVRKKEKKKRKGKREEDRNACEILAVLEKALSAARVRRREEKATYVEIHCSSFNPFGRALGGEIDEGWCIAAHNTRLSAVPRPAECSQATRMSHPFTELLVP